MSRLTDSEWRVLTALWDSGDAALGVALQTSCEKFSYNLQKRNGA